jgi:hypothetical protein
MLGLVNSSQGTIRKIWYSGDPDPCSPNPALPSVVFVEWEGYKGKNFQTEYIVGIYNLFDLLQVLPHLDGMELIHLGFLLFL